MGCTAVPFPSPLSSADAVQHKILSCPIACALLNSMLKSFYEQVHNEVFSVEQSGVDHYLNVIVNIVNCIYCKYCKYCNNCSAQQLSIELCSVERSGPQDLQQHRIRMNIEQLKIFPGPFFNASALWADAFYKSKCPYVCLFVCRSVCSLLRYRLTVFLPPLFCCCSFCLTKHGGNHAS